MLLENAPLFEHREDTIVFLVFRECWMAASYHVPSWFQHGAYNAKSSQSKNVEKPVVSFGFSPLGEPRWRQDRSKTIMLAQVGCPLLPLLLLEPFFRSGATPVVVSACLRLNAPRFKGDLEITYPAKDCISTPLSI